jgi:hypothetical protein
MESFVSLIEKEFNHPDNLAFISKYIPGPTPKFAWPSLNVIYKRLQEVQPSFPKTNNGKALQFFETRDFSGGPLELIVFYEKIIQLEQLGNNVVQFSARGRKKYFTDPGSCFTEIIQSIYPYSSNQKEIQELTGYKKNRRKIKTKNPVSINNDFSDLYQQIKLIQRCQMRSLQGNAVEILLEEKKDKESLITIVCDDFFTIWPDEMTIILPRHYSPYSAEGIYQSYIDQETLLKDLAGYIGSRISDPGWIGKDVYSSRVQEVLGL